MIANREPALATLLTIHRATVGRATVEPMCGGRAVLSLEEARDAVQRNPSDDSRFALRQLERNELRPSPAAPEVLRVWGQGEAFALPGGAKVMLPPRSPLRRVLDQLVRSREDSPGEPVTVDALIRAGWPGEKIRTDAALNRVYVALATLRKQGLRDVISSAGGGYALSRGVIVERVDARSMDKGDGLRATD